MKGKIGKLLPFRGGKLNPAKDTAEGTIVESGTIGDLNWEVYSYGTIHIMQNGRVFKKDCDLFEKELDEVPDNALRHVIKGSGDNDNLVITQVDGEYVAHVEKSGHMIVEKLRELVTKGKIQKCTPKTKEA